MNNYNEHKLFASTVCVHAYKHICNNTQYVWKCIQAYNVCSGGHAAHARVCILFHICSLDAFWLFALDIIELN